MEFEDFKANYDRVEICNLTPDSLTDDSKKKWEVNILEGNWIRGATAGGCRNFIGQCKKNLPLPFVAVLKIKLSESFLEWIYSCGLFSKNGSEKAIFCFIA